MSISVRSNYQETWHHSQSLLLQTRSCLPVVRSGPPHVLTAGSEAGDVHSGAHLVVFGRRGAAWMQTVTVERRSERPGGVVRSTQRRRRERERELAVLGDSHSDGIRQTPLECQLLCDVGSQMPSECDPLYIFGCSP